MLYTWLFFNNIGYAVIFAYTWYFGLQILNGTYGNHRYNYGNQYGNNQYGNQYYNQYHTTYTDYSESNKWGRLHIDEKATLFAFLIIFSFVFIILNLYTMCLVNRLGCCFVEGLESDLNNQPQRIEVRPSQVL